MKKIIKTILPFAFSAVLFTGCYDAVFQSIRKEVSLEDSEVAGFINDITRFQSAHTITKTDGTKTSQTDEFLVLSDGIIYNKQITNGTLTDLTYQEEHGCWFKKQTGIEPLSYDYYGGQFDGEYIIKTASDYNSDNSKHTLYALTALYEKYDTKGRNVPAGFSLYYKNSIDDSFTKITGVIQDALTAYYKACDYSNYGTDESVLLFCTNTVKPETRQAFLRIGNGSSKIWFKAKDKSGTEYEVNSIIYELASGQVEAVPYYYSRTKNTSDYTYIEGNDTGNYAYNCLLSKTLSAVYMGSKVYFLPYHAAIGNGTLTKDADMIYYGNSKAAYWFDEAGFSGAGTFTDSAGNTYNAMASYWAEIKNSSGTKASIPSALKTIDMGTTSSIISITLTSNDVLFGSKGNGVFRALIGSDKALTKTTTFIKNTADIMTSPYEIRTLFTTDPGMESGTASQYSGMDFEYTASNQGANYDNRGLWSFYKERGNWNKE